MRRRWFEAVLLLTIHAACGRTALTAGAASGDGDSDLTSGDVLEGPAGPVTATVLDSGSFPFAMTAGSEAVYWQDFNDGSVHAIPLSGGPPQVLVPSRGTATPVYGMVVAEGNLYQCDSGRGVIERVPLAGGAPTTVVTSPCFGLVADTTYLYWSNAGELAAPAVSRIALDGSSGTEPVGPTGISSGMLVEGPDYFYFTDYDNGLVSRVPIAGGASEVIATTELGGPWGLAVDDTYVYFADHHGGHGGILRVPLSGGAAEPVASGQDGAQSVAVLDGVIYWTCDNGGTVMKLAPAADPVAIATGQSQPENLVVTSGAVYWTTRGGTVLWVAN